MGQTVSKVAKAVVYVGETIIRGVVVNPIKKIINTVLPPSQEKLDQINSKLSMKDFNVKYSDLYSNILSLINKITNEKGLDIIYETVLHTLHNTHHNMNYYLSIQYILD